MTLPKHITVPAFFEDLKKWQTAESEFATARHWTMRWCNKLGYQCKLRWTLKDQIGNLDSWWDNPEEAVKIGLMEFESAEKAYLKEKEDQC